MFTVEDFLDNKKPEYKFIEHTWVKMRNISKPVCSGCGLMRLRNPLTDKAVKRGCLHDI